MQNIKRIAGVVLATAAIASGTTLAAAPAEAKIRDGRYWYSAWNSRTGERFISAPVRISGNWMYSGRTKLRLHSTSRGAYYDDYGMRSSFWRAGNGYNGARRSLYAAPARLRLSPI